MRRTIIGWALLAIILAAIGSGLWIARLAEQAPVSPVLNSVTLPPPRPDVPTSGNLANDRLSNLPSTEQAILLGRDVGQGCNGVLAFSMGMGRHDADKGDGYWSVRCADGRNFAVTLHPGTGGVSVLSCDAMRSAGMECFKRIAPDAGREPAPAPVAR
jgi:hypothetical protein